MDISNVARACEPFTRVAGWPQKNKKTGSGYESER